ncbi:5-deoxy-glucuronate isomerase [Lichenicoccus sp.]|uniref:5-deoxy-glucuronate isomerase n=1 Tax=Lichenicoccus sp. TaxID=2781899 RepID=UPI003D0BE795
MSSKLLRHPRRSAPDGVVQSITPENAGWSYVGFEAVDLTAGQAMERHGDGRELCLVLLSGRALITVGNDDLGELGGRGSPFEGPGDAVYIPPWTDWRAVAQGNVELALCASPAPKGGVATRVIRASEIETLDRGSGTNLRHVRNILPDNAPAETLLVVEVVTPGGHWSSYPPHKHDTDIPGQETYLEETYYHRLARGSGFALQRVYTEDGSLDETMAVGDRDVVLVPRGYHPVGAPHGFDLWYLNVMAGPVRAWQFTMSPDHAHLPY